MVCRAALRTYRCGLWRGRRGQEARSRLPRLRRRRAVWSHRMTIRQAGPCMMTAALLVPHVRLNSFIALWAHRTKNVTGSQELEYQGNCVPGDCMGPGPGCPGGPVKLGLCPGGPLGMPKPDPPCCGSAPNPVGRGRSHHHAPSPVVTKLEAADRPPVLSLGLIGERPGI